MRFPRDKLEFGTNYTFFSGFESSDKLCQLAFPDAIRRATFAAMARHEIYPLDTVVRFKKTGELAIIRSRTFLKDGRNFLHYLGVIEGRGDGMWALFHDDN
jgi:hypothetical protein